MLSAHRILLLVGGFVGLAWLFKLLEAASGLRRIPNLNGPGSEATPFDLPFLTVIVPARNEGENIAATLQSLVGQDYTKLRVIAVDDRSTDGSAAIMDRFAAAYPERAEAMHIRELPAGWLGKSHAMAVAARSTVAEVSPEFLLFTDGDILFAPDILRRSVGHAVAIGADHLVVFPTTIIHTAGEAMILSFLQVMGMWVVRPWRVASPRARDAIGVGAFNLIRTSAYLEIGGFEAFPMEILEDLTLGRRVKAAGLRQRVASAPGAVTVHWAAGLFGILNNMTKNLFAAFRFRPVLLLAAAGWLTIFCLAPVVLLCIGVILRSGGGAGIAWGIPGLVSAASIAGLYVLSERTSRISAWNAVLFPVAAVLVVYSMVRSMVVTLWNGGVTWRGTFYSLEALQQKGGGRPERS